MRVRVKGYEVILFLFRVVFIMGLWVYFDYGLEDRVLVWKLEIFGFEC